MSAKNAWATKNDETKGMDVEDLRPDARRRRRRRVYYKTSQRGSDDFVGVEIRDAWRRCGCLTRARKHNPANHRFRLGGGQGFPQNRRDGPSKVLCLFLGEHVARGLGQRINFCICRRINILCYIECGERDLAHADYRFHVMQKVLDERTRIEYEIMVCCCRVI